MNTRALPPALLVALAANLVPESAAAMPFEPCYDEADRSFLPPVSDEGFRDACETWTHGSGLERDGFRQRAATVLERSVAAWDVPRTRFRLARTYINADQPERALVNAWLALKHGGFGLEFKDVQAIEAIEHYALEHALVQVVLVVEDASSVFFDDGFVFAGPGRWQGVVRPGAIKLHLRPAQGPAWRATRDVEAGERLSIVWPPRGPKAPLDTSVGPTVEPMIDIGPRRASEVNDLMLRLVGFVVAYPGVEEFARGPRAQSQATSARDPVPGEPAELAPKASAVCALARSPSARRVCELHSADRRRFAERIDAIAVALFKLLQDLRKMTR